MTGVSPETRRPHRAGRTGRAWQAALVGLLIAAVWCGPTGGDRPWWAAEVFAQTESDGRGAVPPDASQPPAAEPRQLPSPPPPPGSGPTLSEPFVDVRVEGNTTIPASALAKFIKTRPGRALPPDQMEKQIREDVKALYDTRWFLSVEPRTRRGDDGLELVFRVLERPIVQNVEYLGNDRIKRKVLAAHTGLKPGSAFDVSTNREAARRLEELYRDKGFAFATVELERGGSRQDRDVVFRINEGPKVLVTKVRFDGNSGFSGPLLKTKLQTKTAILWVLGGKYDPATIPNDIAALKQYYHSLGYFDVQIEERVTFQDVKHVPFVKGRANAQIEYVIHEGTQYRIRNVEFFGNEVFSEDDLRKDIKLAEGDPFNGRRLNQDVQSMKDKYGELGRLFARIDAVPVFLEEPGVADLRYEIDEDKPYRFRRIDVQFSGDNPHTKRTVVLNNVEIFPGELASARAIDRSRRLLEGTGYFERGPGPDGVRIDIKRVEEGHLPYNEMVRGQAAEALSDEEDWSGLGDHEDAESGAGAAGTDEDWRQLGAPEPDAGIPPPVTARQAPGAGRPAPEATGQAEGVDWALAREIAPLAADFGPRAAGATPAGDSRVIRGQSFGAPAFVQPQNPIFDVSPQGDPFGRAIREPPEGLLDVEIIPTEARTGRLMFGVGVNSDAGVVGSIVLSEQNFDILRFPTSFQDLLDGTAFRGAGQRFRLEAIPGTIVSRYLVNWTDPHFLDTNFSLGVSGFYYMRFFPDWDERRGGGRVSVGNQLTQYLSVTAAVRLEDVVISRPRLPAPLLLQDALGSSFLSTVRLAAVHDTRDSAFLPSEGHRIEVGYEQAFGQFRYPRVELDASQHFTVFQRADGGGRHILTLASQIGWTDAGTPLFERFFAGGFQTFRGFDFWGVGPVDGAVRVGGRWMSISTLEYMFPMMANEMIHGVVFTDFGTVEERVGLNDFRLSVGAGLRVTVPMMGPVPLAFDWAVPILREDFDDRRIFSFYVGLNR